jgi:sec-independent protein translocase protein TatB
MIDIAWSQFLIITLLAVILLGPKELPLVLRTLGKWFVILRTHLQDLQDYVKAVSMMDPDQKPGALPPKSVEQPSPDNDTSTSMAKDHE